MRISDKTYNTLVEVTARCVAEDIVIYKLASDKDMQNFTFGLANLDRALSERDFISTVDREINKQIKILQCEQIKYAEG